jgi:hypothetical protein
VRDVARPTRFRSAAQLAIYVAGLGAFGGLLLWYATRLWVSAFAVLFAVAGLAAVVLAARLALTGIFIQPSGVAVRQTLRTRFLPWADVAGAGLQTGTGFNPRTARIGVRLHDGSVVGAPTLSCDSRSERAKYLVRQLEDALRRERPGE